MHATNTQRMALTTAKFSELPLRYPVPLSAMSSTHYNTTAPSFSPPLKFRPVSFLGPFCSSLQTSRSGKNSKQKLSNSQNPAKTPPPAPWLAKWPPLDASTPTESTHYPGKSDNRSRPERGTHAESGNKGQNAIERIVLRLRNLGLGSDEDDGDPVGESVQEWRNADLTGEEKLGDLLRRDWIRPDTMLLEEDNEDEDFGLLPWERDGGDAKGAEAEDEREIKKKRTVKAPSLAELTIEDTELRRLRRMGMVLRERVNVPKAGVTQAVLEKIHDKWKKNELVRLKFHEALAHDMKKGHEITERRTGGLVIWRSGSVMVVYRGINYEGPTSRVLDGSRASDTSFIPEVTTPDGLAKRNGDAAGIKKQDTLLAVARQKDLEKMTPEEIEYDELLDSLGPRFVDWWGIGILPVDGDLLPQTIPDFKPPFRLLPVGMRSGLTNAELTEMRKLARSLPCHFALGRNRHHQGLAAAIIKLWEKTLVVKIAVKQGIQNTNNELMSDEIKRLTGGVLLSRNKFYIVIYRGKDFVPPSVGKALAEREELTKQIQDEEEKVRNRALQASPSSVNVDEALAEREEPIKQTQVEEARVQTSAVLASSSSLDGEAPAGTLAEFYQAQARWGREVSTEEREKLIGEASRAKTLKAVKKVEHKLLLAQAKIRRAEKLLSKIESSMVPVGPSDDLETITDEERFMFRKVGLKMKPYLPLGIRGIFDGVIENMHLHWKHRELVKLITKQKTLAFVEETARLLEYESGGILVAIERMPKGFALIYYRGKNYQRPVSIRPRNLLTKPKALKRAVAMQRHEALCQHISELENNIGLLNKELGNVENVSNDSSWSSDGEFDVRGELTQSGDEEEEDDDDDSWIDDSDEEDSDDDLEEDM